MPMIVSICHHCNEQQFRNTVMCTLRDFLSSKVRFMHTSTVTRSHSCSEETTLRRRVHLVVQSNHVGAQYKLEQ